MHLEMRGHPSGAGPSRHLLLRDPRLLLAVPLAVMQTHSISVKQVQVVDSHLQGRECEPLSGTAHTRLAPVLSPGSLQPDGDPLRSETKLHLFLGRQMFSADNSVDNFLKREGGKRGRGENISLSFSYFLPFPSFSNSHD